MIPQRGIFDLHHTNINCVQFSTTTPKNTHDAEAILLYNDSRNPAQFPPMLVLIQWKIIHDNQIRTTIIPYETYTPAVMEDAPHHSFTIKIDNNRAMGDGYFAYNVDPGTLPCDPTQAIEYARTCHTRMHEKQQQYAHIIDELRGAIRHQLRQIYPNKIKNTFQKTIDTIYIHNGYIYTEDYLALGESGPIGYIQFDQLPDIAMRMDSDTLDIFNQSNGDLPFLLSYAVYPISKMHICLRLDNDNISQHKRIEQYRQDKATSVQLEQKIGPIHIYPAPPSPKPPDIGYYYP